MSLCVSCRMPDSGPRFGARGPGYSPPLAVAPGDLLVRVRVNGRDWIQRARLGDGDLPHARELEAFEVGEIEPFTWNPDPEATPAEPISVNLEGLAIQEPARAVHSEVMEFWARDEALPAPMIRVGVGSEEFLSAGVALTVVPAGAEARPAAWRRAIVIAAFSGYSYALLLDRDAVVAPGDRVRSPTAWCIEP